MSASVTKPRADRPKRVRPNLKLVGAAASNQLVAAPPTRPLLNRSSAFVRDLQVHQREAEGEISLIDSSEARADKAFDEKIVQIDADHREAMERLNASHREAIEAEVAIRDAEKLAMSKLRAEFAEIHERCTRALTDGAEIQGRVSQ